MKTTFAILTLALSLGAFAQERVDLNAAEIRIHASSATIVRTNKTPGTVELTFSIPMQNNVCQRYETRYVLRTSGTSCGYDISERRIHVGNICVRHNPVNNLCLRYEDAYRKEVVQHARTCMVPESYCAQYGVATTYDKDTVKIKFNNLPALGDSESETFSVEADQKSFGSNSVVYHVKPLETLRPYKVKQKKFLGFKRDSFVIEE